MPTDLHEHAGVCRTILESLPGTVYMLRTDGRFARWNNDIRDNFAGLTDEQMSSLKAMEIVHPDDLDRVLPKLKQVLETGIPATVELRLLKKGGPDFRWFLVTGTRLTINGEVFLGGVGIDMTSRKEAEDALWQSEQRFRSITEQIEAPVFICDRSGIVVFTSLAIERFSGYTRADVIGRPFSEFLEGEAVATALGMFAEVTADPLASPLREFRLRKKNGSICYAEIRLQFYRDSQTEGAIGLIYDLTQRKRLEALTSFRIRLLQMAESASPEELVLAAVDEAERMTDSALGFFHSLETGGEGYPRRVWSGSVRNLVAAVAGEGADPMGEPVLWEEAVRKKSSVICNDATGLPHGFPLGYFTGLRNVLVVPVSNAQEVKAVFVLGNKRIDDDDDDAKWVSALVDLMWDIIERQRAEQSESRLQSMLMQIQKMEIVGQLAGGIAHDFNNLLGVIIGNVEIALSEPSLDPVVKSCLDEISTAAERSAELTSQLLAFARKQTTLPQLVDLNTVVQDTIGMLQGLIGEKVLIFLNQASEACPVRVDPDQIDQILTSLCLNSRDAMEGEGRIAIGIRKVRIEPNGNLVAEGGMSGEFIELSVADTGSGIAPEHRAHIFEPFYTTKPLGKGTGLGLSTVYGIIKQNRGFIDFDTEMGKGSVFRIRLPLAQASVAGSSTEIDQKAPGDSKPMILVVESEQEILKLCRLMLEKSGYRVLTASSAVQAVRLAREWGSKIDLLITDIVMDDMNGKQLSTNVTAIVPGLKTLFMSGYTAEIVAGHGVIDTGVNFIQKPFTVAGRSGKVKEILAS